MQELWSKKKLENVLCAEWLSMSSKRRLEEAKEVTNQITVSLVGKPTLERSDLHPNLKKSQNQGGLQQGSDKILCMY